MLTLIMSKQTPLNLSDVQDLVLQAHALQKNVPIEVKIAQDYLQNPIKLTQKKKNKTSKKENKKSKKNSKKKSKNNYSRRRKKA